MACRLFGAKSLPEPYILSFGTLEPYFCETWVDDFFIIKTPLQNVDDFNQA